MKHLVGKSISIQLPALATIILGCVGGLGQVLNYLVIPANGQLHAAIAVGLYFLIAAGIPPLTGSGFTAALHLPSWATYLANALLGAGLLALGSIHMDTALHLVLATIITTASALGFNAKVVPIPAK